jgi:hypothetical protein
METVGKNSKSSPKVSRSPRQGRTASQPTETVDAKATAFVEAAGSDLERGRHEAATVVPEPIESAARDDSDAPKRGRRKLEQGRRKVQTPIMIPGSLLQQVDGYIEALGTGMSRSIWICEAIKERLDRQRPSSS